MLDDYIRTPEWFRGLSDIYRSTGGVTGTPRRLLGLMDPIGGRGEAAKGQPCAPPPPKSVLDKEGGRRPPFPFPLFPSSPLLVQQGREGVILPMGVGLLLARPSWLAASSPLLLYIRGQEGTLETQQLIIDLLAVCGAPLHHSPR